MIRRIPLRWLGVAALYLAVLLALPARSPTGPSFGGEAEVSNMRFDRVRPGWYMVDVEVDVKAAAENTSRYVNRVGVTLSIGFRILTGGERFAFYRAIATAVTIQQGKANFRFYLPPEVTARDSLTSSAPDFWAVDLTVDGKEMPRSRRQVSTSLPDPERLNAFLGRVSAESRGNEGVLVPEFQTPFFAVPDPRGAPSYLRQPEAAGR
jgi:hypothetical protein